MKINKPEIANYIEQTLERVLGSVAWRYLVLFSLTYLITLLLTSCASENVIPGEGKSSQLKVSDDFNWSTSQHLILKVQINPDFHLSTEKYKGFPIEVLTDNGEQIIRAALNEKGFVRFDISTPATIRNIVLYSPVTGDKMTIENASGSAVIGFRVKAIDDRTIKGINKDSDGDGVFDIFDDFPNNKEMAFNQRIPFKGYIHHLFDQNWPQKDNFDFHDYKTRSHYYLVRSAKGKVMEARYEISTEPEEGNGRYGLGLQILSLGKLNDGWFKDLNTLEEELKLKSDHNHTVSIDPDAPGSVILYDPNRSEPSNSFSFVVDLSGLKSDLSLGIYNDLFLIHKDDRGLEIHSPQGIPTKASNAHYFGTFDDNSRAAGHWYRNHDNLPWALEIWDQNETREFKETSSDRLIFETAPSIKRWIESNGQDNQDWYKDLIKGESKNI